MSARECQSTRGLPAVRVCIPARWAASRFPGKLLEEHGDRSVLAHAAAIARDADLGPVTVLAADDRIEQAARLLPGVTVVRSLGRARNGSERIAAAVRDGQLGQPELLINLQGDAVGAEPRLLAAALQALLDDPGAGLATVAVEAELDAAAGRTTVAIQGGRATAFSRRALPHGEGRTLLHVGIYAYRTASLLEVAALEPGPLELGESLEQLRWLETGRPVAVVVVQGDPGLARAVDRAADLLPRPGGGGTLGPVSAPPPERPFGRALRGEWLLEEGMAFLNHGSFGATPRRVLRSQERWRTRMERQPLRFFLEEVPSALEASRRDLGALIGAPQERLALVENATGACNAVLRSLDLGPGDEVLAIGHIYPAIEATVDHVCARSGATAVAVDLPFPPPGPEVVVEATRAALTPATKLVVIDHVTSTSALVLPVAPIVALCRPRGVPVLVDGAHAPGMLELDLEALGADFYAGNCHKWLCAAKGCAFLHARSGAALSDLDLHPAVISLNYPAGFPAEFEWVGTRDPTAWLSLTDALALHRELGPARVRRYNRDLVLAAGDLLCQAWGVEQRVPTSMVGSILALPCPVQVEPTMQGVMGLRARLWEQHRVEVMPVTVHGRTWIRISAQVYNELDDYRRLAEALA